MRNARRLARWSLAALFLGINSSPALAGNDGILATIEPPTSPAGIDLSADGRTLFYFGRLKAEAPYLFAFDVSDLTAPNLISERRVGDGMPQGIAVRGDRIFLLYFRTKYQFDPMLAIFDIADRNYPVDEMAPPNGYVGLSDDGKFVVLAGSKGIDISDPADPENVQTNWPATKPLGPSVKPIVPGLSNVFDVRTDRALTVRGDTYRLWDISSADSPQLQRTLSITFGSVLASIVDARIVPGRDAIVLLSSDGKIRIVDTTAPAVTADGLRDLHKQLLEAYDDDLRNKKPYYTVDHDAEIFATRFEAAGVRSLIDSSVAGLTPAERIQILNDYGFWASRGQEPQLAIPALRTVVRVSPMRASAWLNLGDAARLAVAQASRYDEKPALARTSLDAYEHYRRLTGKTTPEATGYLAYNITATRSDDVCQHVADYYNGRIGAKAAQLTTAARLHSRPFEIFAPPAAVDITNDGRLSPFIITTDNSYEQSIDGSDHGVNFFFPPFVGELSPFEITAVPFKDKVYVLYTRDGGPYQISEANVGVPCQFEHHFTPVLVENNDRKLCARLAAGEEFQEIPTAPVDPDDKLEPVWTGVEPQSAYFFATGRVRLSRHRPPVGFGRFALSYAAKQGCGFRGVSIMDGDGPEKSARNSALLHALTSTDMVCRGSNAFLVRVDDQVLYEVRGGEAYERPVPPRALFKLTDDGLETLCRVEQKPHFVPVPAQK